MTDFHVVKIGRRWHVVRGIFGLGGGRRRDQLTRIGYRKRERAQKRANLEAALWNMAQDRWRAPSEHLERLVAESRDLREP